MPRPTQITAHDATAQFQAEGRRSEALRLRTAGLSLREIGKRLGISHARVQQYVNQALDELNAARPEQTERMRTLQGEQLRELLAAVWPSASHGHLASIDRVLRIHERLARLYGLDAPATVDVTVRIRQLAVEMGLDPDEAVAEAQRLLALPGAGETWRSND